MVRCFVEGTVHTVRETLATEEAVDRSLAGNIRRDVAYNKPMLYFVTLTSKQELRKTRRILEVTKDFRSAEGNKAESDLRRGGRYTRRYIHTYVVLIRRIRAP